MSTDFIFQYEPEIKSEDILAVNDIFNLEDLLLNLRKLENSKA